MLHLQRFIESMKASVMKRKSSKKINYKKHVNCSRWLKRILAGMVIMNITCRHQITPPIFVGYELEISPDSCIFTGNGQMTYFRILCTVSKKNENHLRLCYLASLGENNSLPLSNAEKVTVVELYRYNGKYYLKSPYIINKKGKNNVKVKCEKQQ